jgi:hypothetical protein
VADGNVTTEEDVWLLGTGRQDSSQWVLRSAVVRDREFLRDGMWTWAGALSLHRIASEMFELQRREEEP